MSDWDKIVCSKESVAHENFKNIFISLKPGIVKYQLNLITDSPLFLLGLTKQCINKIYRGTKKSIKTLEEKKFHSRMLN